MVPSERTARCGVGGQCDMVAVSTSALRARLAQADGQAKMMLPYALQMLNGQTALTDLQNGRYPDLKLESFEDYVTRTMA